MKLTILRCTFFGHIQCVQKGLVTRHVFFSNYGINDEQLGLLFSHDQMIRMLKTCDINLQGKLHSPI